MDAPLARRHRGAPVVRTTSLANLQDILGACSECYGRGRSRWRRLRTTCRRLGVPLSEAVIKERSNMKTYGLTATTYVYNFLDISKKQLLAIKQAQNPGVVPDARLGLPLTVPWAPPPPPHRWARHPVQNPRRRCWAARPTKSQSQSRRPPSGRPGTPHRASPSARPPRTAPRSAPARPCR